MRICESFDKEDNLIDINSTVISSKQTQMVPFYSNVGPKLFYEKQTKLKMIQKGIKNN